MRQGIIIPSYRTLQSLRSPLTMRITVRGLLIVSIVLVLTTTTLLWQCRPPVNKGATTKREDASSASQQSHRQPLMSPRLESDDLENDYLDKITGVAADGNSPLREQDRKLSQDDSLKDGSLSMVEIPCIINEGTSVSCRKDESEVYIPFSFIHNYFEIYGRLNIGELGNEVFEWSHSYSHFYEPSEPYKPTEHFLNFDQFNVEARERVKCISAIDGIPISTQWEVSGYAYPIQIAQFGLSHYSKYLKTPRSRRIIIEDGLKHKAKWRAEGKGSSFSRPFDHTFDSQVLQFSSPESLLSKGVSLRLTDASDLPNLLVLSVNLQLPSSVNSSLTVTLQTQEKKQEFIYIHYICSNHLIETQDRHIYYGFGGAKGWRRHTRNLMVDLLKGVAASSHPKKMRKRINKGKVRVVSIELRGSGRIGNLSLASAEHLHHFYDAADWFIEKQDDRGGWSIPVPRKVIPGLLEVESGWYSAMAQGQAMSLLVRAAFHSGDTKYLIAAAKATALFSVNSTKGGIRATFPGGYDWYEEYPTSPSMFVLNGFMYSLLGLYDLKEMKSAPMNPSAALYERGMRSLKTLLPLFDCGWGSLYDLRHFTVQVAPNVARWDYHTTHITQLLVLSTVEDKSDEHPSVLTLVAQRWKEYMVGRRAKHN